VLCPRVAERRSSPICAATPTDTIPLVPGQAASPARRRVRMGWGGSCIDVASGVGGGGEAPKGEVYGEMALALI
jgi:hypothetical protein